MEIQQHGKRSLELLPRTVLIMDYCGCLVVRCWCGLKETTISETAWGYRQLSNGIIECQSSSCLQFIVFFILSAAVFCDRICWWDGKKGGKTCQAKLGSD